MRTSTTLARSGRRLAIALGLALLHVGVAGAADFCIQYGNGLFTTTLVAKSYRQPRKGQCKPIAGIKHYSGISDRAIVTGTACTSSDGTALRLVWTEFHPGDVMYKRIDMPLPLGQEGVAYRLNAPGTVEYSIAPVVVPCDSTIPVQ